MTCAHLGMATIKTDGIVLRHTDFGDNDRMVTLLTPQMGLLSFCAYGCRKTNSRRIVATELLVAGEYVLNQKGDRYSLSSFQLSESFYLLREDYDKLSHAVYWLNLCEAVAQPAENCERLYKMLLYSLAVLTYGEMPLRPLTAVFLMQFSILQGFSPSLDHCQYCQQEIAFQKNVHHLYFDVEAGGICCGTCTARGISLSLEENDWLLEAQAKGAFVLAGRRELPKQSVSDINTIFHLLRTHVEFRVDKKIQSGKFL